MPGRRWLLIAAAAAVAAVAVIAVYMGDREAVHDSLLYSGACGVGAQPGFLFCRLAVLEGELEASNIAVDLDGAGFSMPLGAPVMLRAPIYVSLVCTGATCSATAASWAIIARAEARLDPHKWRDFARAGVEPVKVENITLKPGMVAALEPPAALACNASGAVMIESTEPVDVKLFVGQDSLAYEYIGRRAVIPLNPLGRCYTKLTVTSENEANVTIAWTRAVDSVKLRIGGLEFTLPLLPHTSR